MRDDVEGVAIYSVIADDGVVGEHKAAGVFDDLDEDGFVIEFVKLGLDFALQLGYCAVGCNHLMNLYLC